jgi:hypothetical protein
MRVSASGIAGLFYGTSLTEIIAKPKKPSTINDFAKKVIFPHGNVNEHKALEIVKHYYPDTHGQTAFARMIDRSKEFVPDLETDTKYATNARQPRAASFPEFRILQHWKAETEKLLSYKINGVQYDIGRREKKIGNVTLVCQPDGLCQGDKTALEIKCPFGDMYTLDNSEKWLKHVVQAAIEMMVFNTDKAFLVIYHAPRAIYLRYQDRPVQLQRIEMTKTDLGKLISQLATFIHRLGSIGSGDDIYQIYNSCEAEVSDLFKQIQRTLQQVPLQFQSMTIPLTNESDSATIGVVFIGDRNAGLNVGVPYRLVAEPGNQYDAGAIRVMTSHNLMRMPAQCYVTRNSKGSWLLPLLGNIVYCRAVSKDLLEIRFGTQTSSSAASRGIVRRRMDLHKVQLKF